MIYSEISLYEMSQNFENNPCTTDAAFSRQKNKQIRVSCIKLIKGEWYMCLWNVFLSYEIGGSSFYLGLKYGDQGIKDVAWLPINSKTSW